MQDVAFCASVQSTLAVLTNSLVVVVLAVLDLTYSMEEGAFTQLLFGTCCHKIWWLRQRGI